VAVSETEIDHQLRALVEAIRPKTLEEGLNNATKLWQSFATISGAVFWP
jgi:hypothetical protein